jgi:sterol desaturase/sphingolipid hydroxylase (fatty acid hydroxylase superfamily)
VVGRAAQLARARGDIDKGDHRAARLTPSDCTAGVSDLPTRRKARATAGTGINAAVTFDTLFTAHSEAWHLFGRSFVAQWVLEGARYLTFALLLWAVLHGLLRRRLAHRLIDGWPTARDLRREMAYSLSSLFIFAALGCGAFALIISGHAEIYRSPARHGWTWLALSFPAMLLWHDFYFYWTHRLLHQRWWFRRVHGVHHRSRNPSPWAAYAFHPLEALVNGLVTPLALLAVPLHWSVVLAFALHQIVRNAHGHLALETMPRGFARHWLWGRFTTTTHHHLHHETAQGNYGLWFTWWDRWCGTERADYLARFDKVTVRRA